MPATALQSSPPTYYSVPDGSRFTIAGEVADLMVEVGYMVDEPERQALRALLPQQMNGDWTGLESCIVAPRQNLKTAAMIALALHDTFVQGVERVVWTAHEFKTSSDAFRDLRTIIEGTPWLDAAVLKVRTANGKEGFELRNGSRLDILARTGRSGRGMGGDRLYLDEALFLDGKMMGALVPTMSARRNAHIVYGSSPGVLDSEVLRTLRDRGRSGADPQLGYIEWTSDQGECADPECVHSWDATGCLLDDEARWFAANPALGRRIDLEFVRQERRALPPEEFMRERLGWWSDPPALGELSVFPAEAWFACRDDASTVPEAEPVCVAVDVSWDREHACVAVAGLRADGLRHVEVMKYDEGTDWVLPYLLSRRRTPVRVAVQGTGAPAASLLDDLDKAGLPVEAMSGADVGKACGGIYDAVVAGRVRYVSSPVLERAVNTAVARPLGDAWALDRKRSPVDISPLVACTQALWALEAQQGRVPSIVNVWEDDDYA